MLVTAARGEDARQVKVPAIIVIIPAAIITRVRINVYRLELHVRPGITYISRRKLLVYGVHYGS